MNKEKKHSDLDALLYIKDVETIIGKPRVTLRRWWEKGRFPKPKLMFGTRLAWRADVIKKWIKDNVLM